MVTTRSGKEHALVHAIALSKATAIAGKASSKRLVGPKSRAKKIKAAPTLSLVSQSSRLRRKESPGAGSKNKKGSTVLEAGTATGKTPRLRTVRNTTKLALTQDSIVSEKKKRVIAKYIERETDAARTVSLRFRTGDFVGPAFKAHRVDLKKKYPRNFFSNDKGFKVGHQPFVTWKGPSTQAYWDFFNALKAQYDTGETNGLKLDPTVEPLLPSHAYIGDGHKFHALVEPILSCATSNNNQKLGSDNLFHNLSYRNGKNTERISPNYHKLSTISEEEFAVILRPAGRQVQNSKFIMALFNTIRAENIKKRGLTAEEAEEIHYDAQNAEEWTDGLLSLDSMVGMDMQEMFDKLVSFAGIACKTASCIMCFSFHFAVFAVDTHIFRMCQWAGWLPRQCTRDDAFKFFTIFIPPELHRDLHQALWHHAQLCFRCNAKTYHKVNHPQWQATVCPLENLGLVRFPEWEKKNKPLDAPKKAPRQDTTRSADHLMTVSLSTAQDFEDATAANHEVRETAIDDAFGARPDLSNTMIKLKRFLYITRAEASAFRKFQKSRAEKLKKEDGALNKKGHELITVPLKKSKGIAKQVTARKNRPTTRNRTSITNYFSGRKQSAPAQNPKTGTKVVKVQEITTTKKKQTTVLEFTTTTRTIARGVAQDDERGEEMDDE